MALNDWSMPWPGNWRHYHISLRDMAEDTAGGFDPAAVTFQRFNTGAAQYLKTWVAIYGDPTGAGAMPTCSTLVRLPVQVQQGVVPGINQFAISFSWHHADAGQAANYCNWRVGLARVPNGTMYAAASWSWVDARELGAVAANTKITAPVPYLVVPANPILNRDDLFVGIGRAFNLAGGADTLTGIAYISSVILHYRVH